ncbi:succinate dehydrogenase assembly factor 2 [Salinivibrio socompensis]|uniref:FAD assembly factor SdhE n=1 Tax=Salinivibrio socompensis TaxID=1510206 RepID=UPI0004703C82|nr:succinate dehydrogenase assembly factor 2 [Salinivibrio socompensis]
MVNTEDKARIRWACRRGMLELDVLVMPYFEACFDALNEDEKQDFVAFLENADPDLFAWLMGHGKPDDPKMKSVVDKVVAYNRSKLRT